MIIRKYWVAKLLSIIGGIVFAVQLWEHAHLQYSQLDEGNYALNGLLFVIGKYIPFQEYGPWTNHMPLSFLIPGFIQFLFGPGLRTVRYLSIILALLALVAIWITAKRLGGYWWGASAVWIYAASPAMARFYSQSTSQVLIFFMLAWMLVLSLGENLPLWRVISGAILAGIICLTRINMAPVLVFLLGYIFWQFGWRRGLIATLASSIIVTIGIVSYWPGVFDFIVNAFVYGGDTRLFASFSASDSLAKFFDGWFPLRDTSLLMYILLFLGIGVIIVLWLKRDKFIHSPLVKRILWGGVFIALMVLYLWNTVGREEEGFITILTVVGYHVIIFWVFILGVYIWKKWLKKKAEKDISISSEKKWKYYFLLTTIESVGTLAALLLIPSDPKNTWFLGFSLSRIGLISVVLVFTIVALWLTLRTWHYSSIAFRMQNWMVSWRSDKKIFPLILIFLLGAVILGIFLTLQAIIIRDLAVKAPLMRLIPVFGLTIIVGLQTLLLVSIETDIYSSVRRFLFDIFSTLLGVYVILHLDQSVLTSKEVRSINAAIRSHFIPILGLIFMLFFWQGIKKWKKESDFRISVVLSGFFITLSFLHMYATLGNNYCVHCLQPYFAFFSQLGVILLILVASHLEKDIAKLPQFLFVLVILWIFTGQGYVIDFHMGIPLLVWTFLLIAVLAGIKFFLTERGLLIKYSLSAFLAVSCLGVGFLLSPTVFLGGGYRNMDCNVDIISYYESFGEELNRIIPEGAQVFWWGSSPVPLLYLPDRNFYPSQINSNTYIVGGDSGDLLRTGRWNDLLGQQWLYESDFLIIHRNINKGWLLDALDGDNFRIVLHKPLKGTCIRELDYVVYQHLP